MRRRRVQFRSWLRAGVLAAAVVSLTGAGAAARAEAPPRLEPYQLVLLYRAKDAPTLAPAESERIQAAHLGHMRKMAEAGKLVVAGPFDDQPDPALRGMCLYRVGSLAEARQLAEADPAVQARRLRVEVLTWYTEKGALAFPGADKLRAAPAPK